MEWLDSYLLRTNEADYTTAEVESNGSIALDEFLGLHQIQVVRAPVV